MLFHLCRGDNVHPPKSFLRHWGKEVAGQWNTLTFDQLIALDTLRSGSYVFCDQEISSPALLDLLAQVWDALGGLPGVRRFNHPHRVKRRFEFLQILSEQGVNDYRAFRIHEIPEDLRFPVFVRLDTDHNGSRTKLLETRDELDHVLLLMLTSGVNPDYLMVVEFCDTADGAGIYRKYSAFRFGDTFVPRHLIFGRQWMLKQTPSPGEPLSRAQIDEEWAYLREFPQEQAVRQAFELAAIDYGRIDFGMKNGKIQVWEINTNPIIMLAPNEYRTDHLESQEWFRDRAQAAILAMIAPATNESVPFSVSALPQGSAAN